MKDYKAWIFDLNGTMIDDMRYHIEAWHRILNELGAGISIERTKEECYGKNHELLERIFPGRFSEAEKDRLSRAKEEEYQERFRPSLKLLNGLEDLLKTGRAAGVKTAIGSAAIRFNIDFVLDGLDIRNYIDVIVAAEDVLHSKPHPETFLKCAQQLQFLPQDCIVFEDAPKGVEAALHAGMDCIVVCTLHRPNEFKKYSNAIGFINDYNDPLLKQLYEQNKPTIAR